MVRAVICIKALEGKRNIMPSMKRPKSCKDKRRGYIGFRLGREQ